MMSELVKIEPKIKVSVCVVTYNQENYIRECLDSLIQQDVDFNYEIIVGDDASSDGTAEIVKEYAVKYPELIVAALQEKNIGAVANLLHVYRLAKGEYIAHMDGDDFALPNKLKKQVLKLNENLNCFLCTHDVIVVNSNSIKESNSYIGHKEGVNTLVDLYRHLPFFAHSSKMFRNDSECFYYNTLTKDSIDVEIHVAQTKKGNIYHINESLGGYRRSVGISTVGNRVNPLIYNSVNRIYSDALKKNCSNISNEELAIVYSNKIFGFAYNSAYLGHMADARIYIKKSISIKSISIFQYIFLITTYIPYLTKSMVRLRSLRHKLRKN